MTKNPARETRLTKILVASLVLAALTARRKHLFEWLWALRLRRHQVIGAVSVGLFIPAAGCMAMGLAPMAAVSSSEQRGAGAPAGSNADLCPVHVPGTTVEVADTQDYVALLFVTRDRKSVV